MPRYYFDLHVDQDVEHDDTGTVVENPDDVRRIAQTFLPSIAYDEIPKNGDRRTMVVVVTDEAGHPVYSATLGYAGLWLQR